MSNPSSRAGPLPARPITVVRRLRSFTSSARRQKIRRASIPSALPKWRWLSSIAASRLLAAVMAWKSPVKWRLISSIGATCACPPPVAPPLTPKQGPRLGSRRHSIVRSPAAFSASASPIAVVVLPSPAAVGLIPVTSTSAPSARPSRLAMKSNPIFALNRP